MSAPRLQTNPILLVQPWHRFFCFTCEQHVWDCDHLIDEGTSKLHARRGALKVSQLQSFANESKSRVLEIEFRVTAPFGHGELPLPAPPQVIHYFSWLKPLLVAV